MGASATLGAQLRELELAARSRPPLRLEYPQLSPDDAYAIQEQYAGIRRTEGSLLVGRKIGATSQAIQDRFGIDTPDFGHLFSDMRVPDGGSVERGRLVAPMVEPEVAFILGDALRGPELTREDVLLATASVAPCLEIIDSRIDDWDIGYVDTVADNGSSARFVVGEPRPLDGLDLSQVTTVLRRNGDVMDRASGTAVLGHPANAVAWLANALAPYERRLEPGDVILSGSFTNATPAESGDHFTAEFSDLGEVSCTFE